MKKILSILTVGCALTLSSCEDWLDKYPLAQMSPETFFSNENELQAFSNTFYTIFPGDGLYNEGYDNIVKNEIAAEMRDGRTIPASGGGWTWTDLRKFNTLLEYSGNCKDTDIRNRYDAVARFFRAYFYFEKVKRFGDVPWYAKPLGSADPELKRPRDSREFVMQRMIEDIDFAIRYLPAERDLYRVTKWTALALKSRFCLFEGTFRKYNVWLRTRLEMVSRTGRRRSRGIHHQQRLFALHRDRTGHQLPRPVRLGERAERRGHPRPRL